MLTELLLYVVVVAAVVVVVVAVVVVAEVVVLVDGWSAPSTSGPAYTIQRITHTT